MPKVLVADDHPLIRRGLANLLEQDPEIEIAEVQSLPELRNYLTEHRPDVLLLDLSMPGGSVFDAIPEFRRLYPNLAILVLSGHPEQPAGVKSILAGARGYLNKNSAPEEVLRAIREVAEGRHYVSPELGSALADHLVAQQQVPHAPHETLSEREYAVLLKISRGFTTAEIAEQLNLSPKTVGTYRARILEKMGILSTAELTRYVIEKGLDKDIE